MLRGILNLFTYCFENSLRFKRTLVIAFIMVLWSGGVIVIQLTAKPEPDANEPPIIQNQKDDQESFEQCKKDAEAGIPEAQYELSVMYAIGNGVERNEVKSTEWCQKAADAGHAEAQLDIGHKYYTGNNDTTKPDYAKALDWYQKAAASGYPNANYRAGHMFLYGEGVAQDYSKALEYFQQGAASGCRICKSKLGWIYENGIGVEKNKVQADFWYRSSKR